MSQFRKQWILLNWICLGLYVTMLTIIWRQIPKLCITVYCNTEFTVIQSYSFHSKAQQRLKEIYLVKQQPQKSHNKINGWIGIWNLEMLFFEERGEPEYPEKNLSEQRREPTRNSTHIWRWCQDLNVGHNGGKWVLSPLRHHLLPKELKPSLNINKKFYKNIFRSIDWTLRPTGCMPWIILRLWYFLYISDQ